MKRWVGVIAVLAVCCVAQEKKVVNLSSSKTLLAPVIGEPQRVGSFPVSMAVSPDGRWAVILDDGYGADDNEGRQGIGVLDLGSNWRRFFPDDRLGSRAHQTFFVGIAFSGDGTHVYASVASLSDPLAKQKGSTGNGIAVYGFARGAVTPERFIAIAPQPVAAGKHIAAALSAPAGTAVPYPAGLAVVKSATGEQLLVADNLSDDVLLLDAATGRVVHRFDLSTADDIPAGYPYGVIVNRAGTHAWCSLWNESRVAELDLTTGKVARWISLRAGKSATDAGSHPTALMLSPKERLLFVALSNRDAVALVDAHSGRVIRYLSTLLPNERFPGTYPNALAQTADGGRVFVANASSDAVAMFALSAAGTTNSSKTTNSAKPKSGPRRFQLRGFIPTEWYPTALAVRGGDLLIASGKSQGPGPNSAVLAENETGSHRKHPYIASLLHGSVARVNIARAEKSLHALTREVTESNRMNGRTGQVAFKDDVCGTQKTQNSRRACNPIRHVIYVIKENRTYDQVFGDLEVSDADRSLVMYGEEVTPNQHKLARQFGVLDNFYDSGEVSGNGHVWSTAAITSDYTEKTWQVGYRGRERSYDYEGRVADETPLEQGIADVNEPGSGYLWSNAARHGITYRHYGEYVSTSWCDDAESASPKSGTPVPPGQSCPKQFVAPGEPLGGGETQPGAASPWPWPVPIIARNVATKPELRGHFDPSYGDFRMDYPDQLRADEFLKEFQQFERDRKDGNDAMPQLIVLRLPNDHTSGTRPGKATPAAAVADNDLALGRVVDAISHSAYWDDTAILVLEDDAQDGADHVDAHRSIALLVSKYAPRAEKPTVHHEFYTTVNVIHTIESLLGLPPMNNNDANAPLMTPLFAGDGNQPPFTADYRNRDNGLLYQVNAAKAPGAAASLQMDFSHADAADAQALNRILWQAAKGDVPMPEPRHTVVP